MLNILSIGYTRDLWKKSGKTVNETHSRLVNYSYHLEQYHIIANSYQGDSLKSTIQLTDNLFAYATGGYTPIDSWMRAIYIAQNISKKVRIDLIQAQDPMFTGTAAFILGKLLSVPVNICVYGANPFDEYWISESFLHRYSSGIVRTVLRKVDGIQVDGQKTKSRLIQEGISADRISVKPMIPSNLDQFIQAKPNIEMRNRLTKQGKYTFLVLFVGRIAPQKNLKMLLDVAAVIKDQEPEVRFVCVGDGPLRKQLSQTSSRRGLSELIIWEGAKSSSEVIEYMATCDLFVLPSLYEGFARVLMEAAAAGKPIVTTDVSGADEAVSNNENGYIVPVGSSTSFTNAILQISKNQIKAIEMGNKSRSKIQPLIEMAGQPEPQIAIWQKVVNNSKQRG
jgi:glycosyltransferase involved in cell wall biosynthesis